MLSYINLKNQAKIALKACVNAMQMPTLDHGQG